MTTRRPSRDAVGQARTAGIATPAPTVRLCLGATPDRRGVVDGGWWPRSRDATAELPALIAAVDRRLARRTARIGLGVTAWDNIPHRIPAPGRTIKVAWFRSIDPRTVSLSIVGGQRVVLLVIPPDTPAPTAHNALALSAVTAGNMLPVDILDTAHDMTVADDRQHQRDRETDWENEGGRVRQ